MLSRLVLAVVVGIVVALVSTFVGMLLVSATSYGWVTSTGNFLQSYAALLGLLAALYYFFSGASWLPRR
jgi:hypothetical protein